MLPTRSEESFATFPPFQRYTEPVANELVRVALDGTHRRDYTYGPRMVTASIVQYSDETIPDIGWGWMSFLLIIAHRLGRGIYTETLDLPCLVAERIDTHEEKMLRIKQLGDHVDAIDQALRQQL